MKSPEHKFLSQTYDHLPKVDSLSIFKLLMVLKTKAMTAHLLKIFLFLLIFQVALLSSSSILSLLPFQPTEKHVGVIHIPKGLKK